VTRESLVSGVGSSQALAGIVSPDSEVTRVVTVARGTGRPTSSSRVAVTLTLAGDRVLRVSKCEVPRTSICGPAEAGALSALAIASEKASHPT
jgi:hypothetical protein